MPKRRHNMLEAFQASVERERLPKAPQGGPSDEDGALPPGAGLPPFAARDPEDFPALPPEEGLTLPIGPWTFVGLQVAALALAFTLGMLLGGGGDEVHAAGTDDASAIRLDAPVRTAGVQAPPTEPRHTGNVLGATSGDRHSAGERDAAAAADPGAAPVAGGASEQRAADLAFENPANLYTVVVFSVNDYEFGRDRIWALFRYLDEKGLDPITPRTSRGYLVLLVGAAKTMGELEAIKTTVRNLRGPDGKTLPFRDAYINNASSYR